MLESGAGWAGHDGIRFGARFTATTDPTLSSAWPIAIPL